MTGQIDADDADPGGRELIQKQLNGRALLAARETVDGDGDPPRITGDLFYTSDLMMIGLFYGIFAHISFSFGHKIVRKSSQQ